MYVGILAANDVLFILSFMKIHEKNGQIYDDTVSLCYTGALF